MNKEIDGILEYWFGGLNDSVRLDTESPRFGLWFGKNENTDREIRECFEKEYECASQGGYEDWERTPEGRLALVLILDQFPRNMYRDTARAFAADPRALALCLRALEDGDDESLSLVQCMFLYMPMMHAESSEVQEMSVMRYSGLVDRARADSPDNAGFLSYSLEYAKKHKAIIDRFGRYPHRNSILGRESSTAEVEFLKGPDSSF